MGCDQLIPIVPREAAPHIGRADDFGLPAG
jgi:hypothetical protein